MGKTSTSMKEGETRNPGGRPKGSKNKKTEAIRLAFQKLIEDNTGNIGKWLERVAKDEPKEALKIINSYGDYILPKLARQELVGGDGEKLPTPVIYFPGKKNE